MRQKHVSMILFIALFLTALCTIPVISAKFTPEDRLLFENRSLEPAPEWSWDGILSGSYYSQQECYLCDRAAGRTTLLKGKTWCDLNLFHRPVVNDVVVTDPDILLAYNPYEAVDETAISETAEAVAQDLAQLQSAVDSYGGTFLYVAVPAHYAYFEDLYPWYLSNRSEYTHWELSLFTAALERQGVHFLDMGEVWEAEGHPARNMSCIDHHYTWAGAFDVYRHMMERLNVMNGGSLSILSEDDLTLCSLPNPLLGSRSRKLCDQWHSDETLQYVQLKTPIPYTRYDWNSDTPSAAELVTIPETDWESVFYGSYMGGDIGQTILQTNRPELPNALIFGDSFTNPLETIFYASFDETRSLDLRSYEEMGLLAYIEAYQPDVVVCVRDYEQLLNTTGNGSIH